MPNSPDESPDSAVSVRHQAFGRRLKDLRVSSDRTQDQLAAAAGMNRVYYVGVEGGRRNVSLSKVFALADALGVDVGDLFRDLGTPITEPEKPTNG